MPIYRYEPPCADRFSHGCRVGPEPGVRSKAETPVRVAMHWQRAVVRSHLRARSGGDGRSDVSPRQIRSWAFTDDLQIHIDSLLVSVTLQCMQTITIYGPTSVEIKPEELGGENNWFHAGRIATIPKPEPGVWTVRLQGAGPYFVIVHAHSSFGLHEVQFSPRPPKLGADHTLNVTLNAPTADVRFRLVNAAGETVQPIVLNEIAAGRYSGSVIPASKEFRVLAEGTDERGYAFQRVHPPLIEAGSSLP